MPRANRRDEPGAWHHVGNRGIAKCPLFLRVDDYLEFEGLLRRGVELGEYLLHAYCLMTNHFHLLLQSVAGGVSAAMRNLQSMFVRCVNPRSDRQGYLMTGRFWSRRVVSDAYRVNAFRYIHRNPVDANIVYDPGHYPFSSARHYLNPASTRWVERRWAEHYVERVTGVSGWDADRFARVLGGRAMSEAGARWFETLAASPVPDHALMDDVIAGRSDAIQAWMQQRTEIADGGAPLLVVADASSVRAAIAARRNVWPARTARSRPGRHAIALGAEAALLADLAGQRSPDIAHALDVPRSSLHELRSRHRTLMRVDPEYRDEVTAAAVAIITACHGTGNPG